VKKTTVALVTLVTLASAGLLLATAPAQAAPRHVPSAKAAQPVQGVPGRHFCTGYPQAAGTQTPMTVKAGNGSATVTWWDDGDPSTLSYKVIASPQRLVKGTQPTNPSRTKAVGTGCTNLTVTITGLQHKVGYLFWLDEVSKSYEHPSARTESTVGTSLLIYTK
jgi:hypothetical protein